MSKNSMFKDLGLSKVFVENEQTCVEVKDSYEDLMNRTVLACLKDENISVGCEINILLTDDASIRQINNQFRKIDAPTDVLSFPMADTVKGEILIDEVDCDLDEALLMLGDIVISMETAQRQSLRYGHSFERELAFLTSHGVFHLLGYDHMEENEETIMIAKQEAVLDKLGLNRG